VEVLPDSTQSQLEQVRAICEAVIGGKFQEDMTLVGPEVTKCIGKIAMGGKLRVFRYFGRLFPLKKKQRKQISYSPY